MLFFQIFENLLFEKGVARKKKKKKKKKQWFLKKIK